MQGYTTSDKSVGTVSYFPIPPRTFSNVVMYLKTLLVVYV